MVAGGGEGVCQESLCNRSFLLFPGVAAEGEPGRGESRFQVRGWDRWSDEDRAR